MFLGLCVAWHTVKKCFSTYRLCLAQAKCIQRRSRLHLSLQPVLQVPIRLAMPDQENCGRHC